MRHSCGNSKRSGRGRQPRIRQKRAVRRRHRRARVWEIETGELVKSVDVNPDLMDGLSFSSDGELATVCRDRRYNAGFVDIYRVADWEKVSTIKLSVGKELEENQWGKEAPRGASTKFTPDKKQLLVGGGIASPLMVPNQQASAVHPV